jgi:hypothetical protein
MDAGLTLRPAVSLLWVIRLAAGIFRQSWFNSSNVHRAAFRRAARLDGVHPLLLFKPEDQQPAAIGEACVLHLRERGRELFEFVPLDAMRGRIGRGPPRLTDRPS